jgi:hypothetical protein
MGLAQLLTLLIPLPTLFRAWVQFPIWYQIRVTSSPHTATAARGLLPLAAAAGPSRRPSSRRRPPSRRPPLYLPPSLTPHRPRRLLPRRPDATAGRHRAPHPLAGRSRDRARSSPRPLPGRRRALPPCPPRRPLAGRSRGHARSLPRRHLPGRRRALPPCSPRHLLHRRPSPRTPRHQQVRARLQNPSASLSCRPAASTPDGRTCRHHGRIQRRGHHRPWHTPPIAPAAPSSELTHGGPPTSPALGRSTPPPRCPCVAAPRRAFPPSLHPPGVTESRPPPTPRSSAPSPRSRPL